MRRSLLPDISDVTPFPESKYPLRLAPSPRNTSKPNLAETLLWTKFFAENQAFQNKMQQKQHINSIFCYLKQSIEKRLFLAAIFKSLIISTSWFTIFLWVNNFFEFRAKNFFCKVFPLC